MNKPASPEMSARAESFLRSCIASGVCVQRGTEPCTRRWSDKEAHREYRFLLGHAPCSSIPRPAGSMALKEALSDVCEHVGMKPRAWYKVWRQRGVPFVVVRQLRTRIDVDPSSLDDAKRWMEAWCERRHNAGKHVNFPRGNGAQQHNNRASNGALHSPAGRHG